jgi:hypothetical protein
LAETPSPVGGQNGIYRQESMFTVNNAVLPFPLRRALSRVDNHLDELIYYAFPLQKAG